MRGALDTIFAAATSAARAAITVVRISGEQTGSLVTTLCGALPQERRASLRMLREAGGAPLDRALVLWFAGPASYTGEDCAELHLHGGRATLQAVGRALAALGARPAEPGEFTRRAFLNGRLDLLQAEAVADLVEAETESQRIQALRQLGGTHAALYQRWAERLRTALARAEAAIDFADDDGGIELGPREAAACAILRAEIEEHLEDGRRSQRLRDGLVFAILGRPNVGKSSLMNALVREDVAIVASSPGTTRDALEHRVTFGDVPVTLVDTAGLRRSRDPVEQEGVRRARVHAQRADLVLHVADAGDPPPIVDEIDTSGSSSRGIRTIVIANKTDLVEGASPCWAAHAISVHTGAGMAMLRRALDAVAGELAHCAGGAPITRLRHRTALCETTQRLRGAEETSCPELRAENMRLAVAALGRVTGETRIDDVLDEIFAQFCIGK